MEKRLVSVGKFKDPEDREKPYWVSIEWFEGKLPVVQPVSEGDFFMLLGRIFGKYGPVMLDVGVQPS